MITSEILDVDYATQPANEELDKQANTITVSKPLYTLQWSYFMEVSRYCSNNMK